MEDHNTQHSLSLLLLNYLRGQGTITCIECLDNLHLPKIFRDFAVSQNIIGWDGFVSETVLSKLLSIQSAVLHSSRSSPSAKRWITGLITQLLQVMHTQWIYRCVLVTARPHDGHTNIGAYRGPMPSAQMDLTNRTESCLNATLMSWHLPQANYKSTGC
jgi:hypothetical protein